MHQRPTALLAAGALVAGMSALGPVPAAVADSTQSPEQRQAPPTAQLDQRAFAERLPGIDRLEQLRDQERLEQRKGATPGTDHRGRGHGKDREDRALRRALDRAAEGLAEDGAVGLSARVEAPGFSWRGAAGHREVDHRAPARPHDRFRVASVTKTMVATVVLQEIEDGNLTLDTKVNDVIPGLFPDQPDVTVEHLLSHRSGAQTASVELIATRMTDLADWGQFLNAVGEDYTPQDHLDVANELPWLFQPGSGFSYSNAGYVALGMVLEEVTGEDLEDLLEDRVFDEAGMRHTSYPDDPRVRGPFLVGAMWTGEAADGGIGWSSLRGFDPDVFGAAGAVVSTTRDLNRFTEALTSGELLEDETLQDMVAPRTEEMGYGLGVYRIPDPCTGTAEDPEWLYGHDGMSFGTATLAFSSADGSRQISLGTTGRDMTSAQPLAYDLNELLVPMIEATCGD